MGFLDAYKEPKKEELIEVEYIIYSAAYFQEEIEKYMSKVMPTNNRYILETYNSEKSVVWKHEVCNVSNYRFDKEPKNANDKNAIKIVALPGAISTFTLGYIPKEDNIEFGKLIDNKKVYNVNIIVCGGERKIISKSDVMLDKVQYKVILKVLIRK